MSREKAITDILTFCRLWNNPATTVCEITRVFRVSETTVRKTANRLGLQSRRLVKEGCNEPPPVEESEESASGSSLRLAPTVEAAAEEVRRRWTEQEEYNHRVTRVQPVTYGGEFL
jgi:hypothetical protein